MLGRHPWCLGATLVATMFQKQPTAKGLVAAAAAAALLLLLGLPCTSPV